MQLEIIGNAKIRIHEKKGKSIEANSEMTEMLGSANKKEDQKKTPHENDFWIPLLHPSLLVMRLCILRLLHAND